MSGAWKVNTVNASDNGLTLTIKDTPAKGDPNVDSVSLKRIDANTFEESDKRDGKVIDVTRFTVSAAQVLAILQCVGTDDIISSNGKCMFRVRHASAGRCGAMRGVRLPKDRADGTGTSLALATNRHLDPDRSPRCVLVHWAGLSSFHSYVAINGGQSTGPLEIGRPWDAYTDDHLGLMDHLGIEKFMVLGFCIGGPFIWNLLRRAPDRICRSRTRAAQRVASGEP